MKTIMDYTQDYKGKERVISEDTHDSLLSLYGKDWHCSSHYAGFICTRSKNHEGIHVALGSGEVCAIWKNENEPQPTNKEKHTVVVKVKGIHKVLDGEYEIDFRYSFDKIFCALRHDKHFCNPVAGVAYLHPKEYPTQSVGEKIALVRAVKSFMYILSPLEKLRVTDDFEVSLECVLGKLTSKLVTAWKKSYDQ